MPVVQDNVEELEDKPEKDRQGSEEEKFARMSL
jgi:hypothetical protein